MNIPLIQNNEKDSINTSIIAIKRTLERINSLLGLTDSENDIDTNSFVKKSDVVDVVQSGNMNPVTSNAVVPVDEVTSGNMQSVTSNAVANGLSGIKYLIPIRTTFVTTNSTTDYTVYKQLGNFFSTYFNNLPTISGMTKKVRLLFNAYSQSSNTIIIGLKRRNDVNYTDVISQSVWGGISEQNFSNLYWVEIDPSYLDSYTVIGFKTNNSSWSVGIGFCFAEVYYDTATRSIDETKGGEEEIKDEEPIKEPKEEEKK